MQDESNKPRRKKERHGTSRQRRNASTEIYTIVCNALNQYPNKALGELAEMLSVEHAENHTLVSLAFHRFWLAAIRGVSEGQSIGLMDANYRRLRDYFRELRRTIG